MMVVKKVVFLSMDNLAGFECYDSLLFEPLEKLGWHVETISWRKPGINWNEYDAVIVRSTWDYQSDPQKFLIALENINKSLTHLENNLSIIKWNMNKSYLADMQDKGIHIVNTIWENSFLQEKLEEYFNLLNSEEIIIKPNISANADNTFRLNQRNFKNQISNLKSVFQNREFMIQPFIKSIIYEGEYSLFYFGGEYSHAILKKPKENDFRVQEEHGGKIFPVNPDPILKSLSENILNKIESIPLYARVDLVRTNDNDFALIELELIEPSLYFNYDSESANRFARVFNDRMKNNLL